MGEREDLVAALGRQRYFLTKSLDGVTDDDARKRTTVSELTLGGLIKHVGRSERQWCDFVRRGPAAMSAHDDPEAMTDWLSAFTMTDDESVADVRAAYSEIAAATDELFRTLPDLDAEQPLPSAPWFEPGANWSARTVALHLLGEIAQHAGHADILREALDGVKSMG